ncbi:DNA adenine methylase [Tsukamurella tyrosinosolvens]|uniref:DNA adenine methylase n=1 Tax=Tsukamurella tyrosinosolvens TaxID=57704 RepID=UPI001CE15D73|nr:DNA adenine methylase [Tsukamurella tyrosinosolvens]MCA4995125.1 DNA adenine methylase [Tsukamurella tyrosinosolvens]
MQWKSDGARAIPQAFPYQGSKRVLAGQILSLFPQGGVPLLIEPFAGSAAISVAARKYGLADQVWISDVNEPLIDLWNRILKEPEDLAASYNRMWHEQQALVDGETSDPKGYFFEARQEFNVTKDPDILMYLLARCVKAAVRYAKNGDFNQSADNRRLGAKPKAVKDRIFAAHRLLSGRATAETVSYEAPLVEAPREALVYMDPPYQGTTDVPDHRYLNGLSYERFSDTLQQAVDNDVSFIVSYDVVREDNKYGRALPAELGLLHRNVVAGKSSQATLLGREELSVESLYVSPALVRRLGGVDKIDSLVDLEPTNQDGLF